MHRTIEVPPIDAGDGCIEAVVRANIEMSLINGKYPELPAGVRVNAPKQNNNADKG